MRRSNARPFAGSVSDLDPGQVGAPGGSYTAYAADDDTNPSNDDADEFASQFDDNGLNYRGKPS